MCAELNSRLYSAIQDEESEESVDRAYAAALEAAVAEGCIRATDQDSDVTEDAKSAAQIKVARPTQ